jgi:hypothetical protein
MAYDFQKSPCASAMFGVRRKAGEEKLGRAEKGLCCGASYSFYD